MRLTIMGALGHASPVRVARLHSETKMRTIRASKRLNFSDNRLEIDFRCHRQSR